MSNKIFQWVKGEHAGNTVKWKGDIENVDGVGNFLIFENGTRANEILLNDYLVEIHSEEDLILMPEPAYLPTEKNPPLQRVFQQEPAKPQQVTFEKAVSPLHSLLAESKKSKTTVTIPLVADMPPVDLMRVLADSYEDGEKQVLDYIASTLNAEDVKQQIAKQIWITAFMNKPKKQRNVNK